MTLVFIYGPPGVGKLTTARALAELTGFRVFHDHLTVNLVARWNLTAAIPARDTLAIDNSAMPADAAARRIAVHFSLPLQDHEGSRYD